MKIDTVKLDEWAKNISARSDFPRLLRQLIHALGKVSFTSVPAGTSVTQGGWDGEVIADAKNAWVPSASFRFWLRFSANTTVSWR